ncbi:GNAT family N-acetyltransferase [Cesiribacter andamanensis]|uniref:Putative acetyltransferase n=1 Tax=Cesiribacter andamanensis AMV16 TaxID=1279009 RepID=M7NT05_9BACT|nr:GNAT family N-acetyltransferase [Cesiribacter andamanensis]EMR04800.1 putative acetyltransferase [Cesiribacter andamanensis AMV16]
MDFTILTSMDTPSILEKTEIANFLFEHLDQFGDAREDIMKCLDYALSPYGHQGGFVLLAREGGAIVGAVVMNQTGMEGYIPENILVYIAVHGNQRGKGLGRQLMERAIAQAKGGIALHVEPDNPARRLYERLGFTNKYLEMRLTR